MSEPRDVLTQYGIRDPFPTSWPSNKDDSDESDGESSPAPAPTPQLKPKVDRSKSRYTVLERTGPQRRSLVPGTEMTQDGLENLVQKDEPDPLGKTNSVVRALQASGLSVEDEKLRNQFLLSSTTFNPALFLSRVQGRSSTDELYRGLEVLSLSIDQKSASLKVLVESNFERFVRAKSTIDSVYTEMRNQGIEAEAETRRPHSRHTSRSSNHFRSISGQNLNFGKTNLRPLANEKRKHALIKESEYGVQGVKAPLVDVGVKAEEVWGAALGGKDRENTMRTVLDGIEKGDEILNLPDAIASSIKTKDYEKLVQDYTKAKNYMEESRTASDNAVRSPKAVPDNQIYRILLISKIWSQIEKQVKGLKRDVWIALTSEQANMTMSTDRSHQDDHIALISVLLSLGVKDNPIEVWLLSRYDYLLNKINMTFERSRMEIEVFRRRLGNAERPGLYASAVHYRSPTRTNTEDRIKHLDTAPILELWDLLVHAMGNLLSLQGGILGEVIDFAEKAQSFIDGEAQRSMPTGIDGRSKSHHRLSQDGLKGTHEGVLHLVNALREHIHAFFIEAPIEDISTLFSPIPHSPETPNNEAPRTPKSAALLSPFSKPDQRFNLDLLSPPPPSPRKNEFWEVFAFWPPYANSLSGVHFLSKIVLLVGTAAAEMSGIQAVMSKPDLVEQLKAMLNAVRQRSAEAVCSAWQQDANTCKVLEDWTRGPDSRDITRWPDYFSSLEAFIISGTQKILYVPEAALSKGNAAEIITPPPGNLLNKIKKQFVRSISDASFSMASNASEPMDVPQNPWSSEGIVSPLATKTDSIETSRNAVDASSQNLRVLLTLSNISALRTSIVPSLVQHFESSFSVTLTEESGSIADLFQRIESQLFQSYTAPKAASLSILVHAGITSPAWEPAGVNHAPAAVSQYIYAALLQLVHVHSEVSSAAPPLVPRILSHLLEQTSRALLEAFQARASTTSGYSLSALMQATLDVEFFAQTLSVYATKRAGEVQSSIYRELDQGTDNNARVKLQDELPQMRAVLKRLREATRGEFACFRKVKKESGAAPVPVR